MAHFYGILQGSRGETTRCGTRQSGVQATVKSWTNSCTAEMQEYDGKDMLHITVVGEKGLRVKLNGVEMVLRDGKVCTVEEHLVNEL